MANRRVPATCTRLEAAEEAFERGGVAILCGGCERVEEPALLGRPDPCSATLSQAPSRARDELPRVRFLESEYAGDVVVRVLECLTKDVRGPLRRWNGQRLQK